MPTLPIVYSDNVTASERSFFRQHLSDCQVDYREEVESFSGLYLVADQQQGLGLACVGQKGVVRADFISGAMGYRRLHHGKELIAKAVDCKRYRTVWDATGGLGRDSFMLALMGMEVVVFECNPVVLALLSDGLYRAKKSLDLIDIVKRINLIQGDFVTYSPEVLGFRQPEIVYLDPMYPERKKHAQVKKEMAYFQQLIDGAGDEQQLLQHARLVATKRVVVKRPLHGVYLADTKPNYNYQGKSTRFDIYHPATMQTELL